MKSHVAAAMCAALAMLASPAWAQTKTVTALDLAVDWKDLVGESVQITGCTILNADLTSAFCAIDSPTGNVGEVQIDSASMDRASLRAALTKCAGLEEMPECRADVLATVTNAFGDVELVGAVLSWK